MKKRTFWKKDTRGKGSHLRFIISNRDDNNMVLVVNMTTFYDNGREDKSCILDVGDYDLIKQKSWIIYRESEELDITKLLQGEMSGGV